MTKAARVVVVGAGVGGLAAAIDLAAAGCQVTVLERSARAGGKMGTAKVGGACIDTGPTVLTMRWVFDELFASVHRSLESYVGMQPAEIIGRHAWPDGARLDLFADVERSVEAIHDVFGATEAQAFRTFSARTRTIYETVEAPFLRSQRPGLTDALRQATAQGPGVLGRIDALRTMWKAIESTFGDPRLRQLFGRYATYCGSSPFEAPATLNLIAHVEQLGVHSVMGGMRALAEALTTLAEELGVTFRFDAQVIRIVVGGGRARRVVLADGDAVAGDAIVFNGDVSALASGLLGPDVRGAVKPVRSDRRSLSAVTWAMVARAEGFPLAHHNVFFSRDYASEFKALLGEHRGADEPTVYVCAQDRGHGAGPVVDGTDERLFIIVNAPPTGADTDAWTNEEIQRWERATFSTLSRSGLSLTPRARRVTTPHDFDRRFPATGGALYGVRSMGAFSSLARPGARSRTPGLYLAGGSVHPGPGVPMAALSGRLAARQILGDLASTRRSCRAAISGTTSTP
jgi:1-hydroxycarotenoid 3,4-desaturase